MHGGSGRREEERSGWLVVATSIAGEAEPAGPVSFGCFLLYFSGSVLGLNSSRF